MTKTDINKALKELGYGFVKVSTGGWDEPKCYTGFDGKRVKGISGGSVGPLTSSNTYEEKNQRVISEVTDTLRDLGMREQEDGVLVSPNGKIKVSLTVSYFPAYTRSAGYDESYQNAYIQPIFQ